MAFLKGGKNIKIEKVTSYETVVVCCPPECMVGRKTKTMFLLLEEKK
jgi:hypothetical protein